MKTSRRIILASGFALALVSLLPVTSATSSTVMSAPEALEAANRGELILVDIRTRAEWRETGLAEPAKAISMHEAGFVRNLTEALGGDRTRPLALICATGGRSAHMSQILATAGFSNIIDVSEGMIGSSVGPGWIKRGLPLKTWVPN